MQNFLVIRQHTVAGIFQRAQRLQQWPNIREKLFTVQNKCLHFQKTGKDQALSGKRFLFLSLPSFVLACEFCCQVWLNWKRHTMLCSSEGSAKHGHLQCMGWLCSWMHCFSSAGNCCPQKITPIQGWSGHIIHVWARKRVMQSQYSLKSERLISFALWSIGEKPCKYSHPRKAHMQIISYCLL